MSTFKLEKEIFKQIEINYNDWKDELKRSSELEYDFFHSNFDFGIGQIHYKISFGGDPERTIGLIIRDLTTDSNRVIFESILEYLTNRLDYNLIEVDCVATDDIDSNILEQLLINLLETKAYENINLNSIAMHVPQIDLRNREISHLKTLLIDPGKQGDTAVVFLSEKNGYKLENVRFKLSSWEELGYLLINDTLQSAEVWVAELTKSYLSILSSKIKNLELTTNLDINIIHSYLDLPRIHSLKIMKKD